MGKEAQDALSTCTLGFEAGFLEIRELQHEAVVEYDVFET
mgnify:CR=1 FL=1